MYARIQNSLIMKNDSKTSVLEYNIHRAEYWAILNYHRGMHKLVNIALHYSVRIATNHTWLKQAIFANSAVFSASGAKHHAVTTAGIRMKPACWTLLGHYCPIVFGSWKQGASLSYYTRNTGTLKKKLE